MRDGDDIRRIKAPWIDPDINGILPTQGTKRCEEVDVKMS